MPPHPDPPEHALTSTRRDFLATTATASLGRPRHSLAQQALAPQATFTPIRRNVGFFTMRGGTIGWLVNPAAVVVVDSQFPTEATACLAGLKSRSGNRGVDALINTHHHGDHSGGNISFRGAARRVVAHSMADQHMRRPPGRPAPVRPAV
ncbi:MAG: MBL fold metallo-hydrolase, partial [Gemmatimonadota bacterium]|nr:MBL fold metallo-hydrolase [Gemmatimonadota bacterium]